MHEKGIIGIVILAIIIIIVVACCCDRKKRKKKKKCNKREGRAPPCHACPVVEEPAPCEATCGGGGTGVVDPLASSPPIFYPTSIFVNSVYNQDVTLQYLDVNGATSFGAGILIPIGAQCIEVAVPCGAVAAQFSSVNVPTSYSVPLLGIDLIVVNGVDSGTLFPQVF